MSIKVVSEWVHVRERYYLFLQIPGAGDLFSYYVDFESRRFEPWKKLSHMILVFRQLCSTLFWFLFIQTLYFDILVPTVDTVRYGFLMQKLLSVCHSVLFTGTTGVGKVRNLTQLSLSFTQSLTHSRTHSLTHSLTHPFTHSPALTHSLFNALTHSTHSPTALTHSRSRTHSLSTHSHTHLSLTSLLGLCSSNESHSLSQLSQPKGLLNKLHDTSNYIPVTEQFLTVVKPTKVLVLSE